jgi:hypothetical protein
MMIDADQYVPQDAFVRLWNILEKEGHDKAIAYGWTILKTGEFAGKPGVFKVQGGKLRSIEDLQSRDEPLSVDAIGTSCLLFSVRILERIPPPYFADVFVLRENQGWKTDDNVIWVPTHYAVGQDISFSKRMREAGVKIIVDPKVKLPHEVVGAI